MTQDVEFDSIETEAWYVAAQIGVDEVWRTASAAASCAKQGSPTIIRNEDGSCGSLSHQSGQAASVDEHELSSLLQRTQVAKRQLRAAHDEMREALFEIRMQGKSLHPKPVRCLECGFVGRLYHDQGDGSWFCAQCWYDCHSKWPVVQVARQRKLVLEKYDLHDILGQGVFSTVRQASNTQTSELVAVKVYSLEIGTERFYCDMFIHAIEALLNIHDGMDLDFDTLDLPDCDDLYVELLDFSKDVVEPPGIPAASSVWYIVLEMGQYTLDEFLQRRADAQLPLTLADVQLILWQLAEAFTMLHSKGLIHTDLKPLSIMYFPKYGRWKLLDIDGVLSIHPSEKSHDVFYTPLYCAPEFAEQLLGSRDQIIISRELNVWSLGALAVELVTLRPWLQDNFDGFLDVGIEEFTGWLASQRLSKTVQVPHIISELDQDFSRLCENMLGCSGDLRPTMRELLDHPFINDAKIYDGDLGQKSVKPIAFQKRSALVGRDTCVRRQVFLTTADIDTPGAKQRASKSQKDEQAGNPMQFVTLDWEGLRTSASQAQKQASELLGLLRQQEEMAVGMDAVVWAAAESEAALFQKTSWPLQQTFTSTSAR